MEPEGTILKNRIWGRGMAIKDAAKALGMSREKMYYYLNMAILPEAMKQNIKTKLNIDLFNLDEEKGIINEGENVYGTDDIKSKILAMGELLRIPLETLYKMQRTETRKESIQLIEEAIELKKRLEFLENENRILKEYNELLTKENRSGK